MQIFKKASKKLESTYKQKEVCLNVGKIFNFTSWENWPIASIFACRQKGRGFKSHKERKEMEAVALKLEVELMLVSEVLLVEEVELVMESLEWGK